MIKLPIRLLCSLVLASLVYSLIYMITILIIVDLGIVNVSSNIIYYNLSLYIDFYFSRERIMIYELSKIFYIYIVILNILNVYIGNNVQISYFFVILSKRGFIRHTRLLLHASRNGKLQVYCVRAKSAY